MPISKPRKKPQNKRCKDGYPCKKTCISRKKNCLGILRHGNARTYLLWLGLQEEQLALTNKKRERMGLSPATMDKTGYIVAERNFTGKKQVEAATPIESKSAIASSIPKTRAIAKPVILTSRLKEGENTQISYQDWEKNILAIKGSRDNFTIQGNGATGHNIATFGSTEGNVKKAYFLHLVDNGTIDPVGRLPKLIEKTDRDRQTNDWAKTLAFQVESRRNRNPTPVKSKKGASYLADPTTNDFARNHPGVKAIADAIDNNNGMIDTGLRDDGSRGLTSGTAIKYGEVQVLKLNKPSKSKPYGTATIIHPDGAKRTVNLIQLADGVNGELKKKATPKSSQSSTTKKEPSQIEKSLIRLFQEKATTMSLEAFNAEVVDGLIMRNKGGYKMLTDALGLPETIDITSLQNHLKSLPKPEKAPTPNDRADRALEPLKELAKLRIDPEVAPSSPETKPVAEVQSKSKNNGNGSESAIAKQKADDEADFQKTLEAYRLEIAEQKRKQRKEKRKLPTQPKPAVIADPSIGKMNDVLSEYGWSIKDNKLYNSKGVEVRQIELKKGRIRLLDGEGKLRSSLSSPEGIGKHIEKFLYAVKTSQQKNITPEPTKATQPQKEDDVKAGIDDTPKTTGDRGESDIKFEDSIDVVFKKLTNVPDEIKDKVRSGLMDGLRSESLWNSTKARYKQYADDVENGNVPKGYGSYYDQNAAIYNAIIKGETFVNERRKAIEKGDYQTSLEANLFLSKKIKNNKEFDYFDSPEYTNEYNKLDAISDYQLPPPLTGTIPSSELKKFMRQGDQLLVKEDTYGLGSNRVSGTKVVDGGTLIKTNVKNAKTKNVGEYMGKPYERENNIPIADITHVIRDGKRYKVI